MAVRLSALRAGRALPPQESSWYSFLLEAEFDPRAKVRLEGLGQFKKCNKSISYRTRYRHIIRRYIVRVAGRPRDRSSSPGRVKNVLFSTTSRLALGSYQPLIQWVPGGLSRGYSGRGVKLITYLQLLPRSRNCAALNPPPIRLHGVMLSYLSTGTTLPFYLHQQFCHCTVK
jgi:hypothetical protein